jgi:hypothetical protein
MNSRIAGIGVRIEYEETLIAMPGLVDADARAALRGRHDAHGVAVGQEAGAAVDDACGGVQPGGDLDAVAAAAADLDLGLAHARIGVEPEDVAEAVAQQHRALRQRQRRGVADLELAAREHPGLHAAGRQAVAARRRQRQVDVDEPVARGRVDGRRDHAHAAGQRGAACRRDAHRLAGAQQRQVGRGDFGTPFQPALADHAKQLLPGRQHGADGGAARRDHAVVGRQHLRLPQPQLLLPRGGTLCLQSRRGRALGGEVLVDLLRRQCAAGLQVACALGVGAGVGEHGLGLGHRSGDLRQVGAHRVGAEGRQHLAALHAVADVDTHLGQTQAVGFGADAGLLPRRDAAVGRHRDGPGAALRLRHRDGERRLGGGAGGRRRHLVVGRAYEEEGGDTDSQHGGGGQPPT